VGVQFSASGATLINTGTIAGGNGGALGPGDFHQQSGNPGLGGASIVGGGLTVINSGTVRGGTNGGGLVQANAITFTGGTNVLELQAGSKITGDVVAFSSADTLRLGGGSNASFDVSQIGSQYQNFGVFQKTASGTWTLTNTTAATTNWAINGGTLAISADNNLGAPGSTLLLNGGTLQTTASLSSARAVTLGNAGGTFDTGANTLVLSGAIGGAGSLTKIGTGMLSLNGTNTYTGATIVNGGTLVVNGSLSSPITLFSGGTLGGNGTTGTVVAIGATLAPGNSIGTLTVNGNFAQLGGIYQVEANAAGQSDRINVSGTATISSGATVQALAQPGSYGRSTTYTILRANGGVSGTYFGVTSNFAFLTPSLSYDANDVFLTLSMAENAFSFGGRTYNQRQVGRTLDQTFNGASGDYATVLNAIAGLGTANGPQTLDMISGQQYAGFANAWCRAPSSS
jgi:autotransporter-associated beta strand protein